MGLKACSCHPLIDVCIHVTQIEHVSEHYEIISFIPCCFHILLSCGLHFHFSFHCMILVQWWEWLPGGGTYIQRWIWSSYKKTRVRIRFKILYSNFLFIHHEAEVGSWFYIAKTAIQAEICVAKCLKCGAFCSTIQLNLHPDENT